MIPPNSDRPDAAVAGLAREVDGLRRQVASLQTLSARVDELSRLVTDIAETVTALGARKPPTGRTSWRAPATNPGRP